MVLAGEPLCRECTRRGLTVVATDVDHRDNDPTNNDLVNLQPLCHVCHSRKTAKEMGGNVAMGCDEHGMPLDPSHPWNATVSGLMKPSVKVIPRNIPRNRQQPSHREPGASSLFIANRKHRP